MLFKSLNLTTDQNGAVRFLLPGDCVSLPYLLFTAERVVDQRLSVVGVSPRRAAFTQMLWRAITHPDYAKSLVGPLSAARKEGWDGLCFDVPTGSLAEDPAMLSMAAITHPDIASLVHPLSATRKEGIRKRV